MARTTFKSDMPRRDLYADVTQQIVTAIEAGAGTWEMPWHKVAGPPKNISSKKPYRGINTLILWLIAQEKGYTTPLWATFKQWQEMGCSVRKGEKSASVVFWKFTDQADQAAEDGEDDNGRSGRVFARSYAVFNAAQVDGFELPTVDALSEDERQAKAEAFFNALPLKIVHEGDRAYYRPSTDTVVMPPFAAFKSGEGYYATLGHECVHATGAKSRLERDFSGRFGDEAYALEELVAELGAAFLCADLGISSIPRPDHAAYLQSWLKVLKADTRAIFTAASKAQQAVDWLHTNQVEQLAA